MAAPPFLSVPAGKTSSDSEAQDPGVQAGSWGYRAVVGGDVYCVGHPQGHNS